MATAGQRGPGLEIPFFGEWLVRVGAIDAKQLDAAIEQMRRVNRRLDDLAVARGWLTPGQARELHRAQLKQDRLWGAVAVETGLLEKDQVEELLREQGVRQVRLGQVLVELGHIDEACLGEQLDAFHHAARIAMLSRVPPSGMSACPITRYVIEHVSELSMRMGSLQLKLGSVEPWVGVHDASSVVARISVTGDVSVTIGLEVDRAFCEELACGFMGIPADELDAHLRADLLREFLNVLAANARSALTNLGSVIELGVPQHGALEPPAEAMALRTPRGRGWIAFRYA